MEGAYPVTSKEGSQFRRIFANSLARYRGRDSLCVPTSCFLAYNNKGNYLSPKRREAAAAGLLLGAVLYLIADWQRTEELNTAGARRASKKKALVQR